MTFNVLGRGWEECLLLETSVAMGLNKKFRHFLADDYGSGIESIAAFLNCLKPTERQIQGNRLDRKTKTLYVDVPLKYDVMVSDSVQVRQEHYLQRLREEIPAATIKYQNPDFDAARFNSDFVAWIDFYPPLPSDNLISKIPGTYDEILAGRIEDLLPMVLVDFGDLAAGFGLQTHGEVVAGPIQGVHFANASDDRSLTVFASGPEMSLVAMAQSRKAGRLIMPRLSLELENTRPGEEISVMRFLNDPRKAKPVGSIVLPDPGGFRGGLRALSQCIQSKPELLFP